jgi:hypothetical protein
VFRDRTRRARRPELLLCTDRWHCLGGSALVSSSPNQSGVRTLKGWPRPQWANDPKASGSSTMPSELHLRPTLVGVALVGRECSSVQRLRSVAARPMPASGDRADQADTLTRDEQAQRRRTVRQVFRQFLRFHTLAPPRVVRSWKPRRKPWRSSGGSGEAKRLLVATNRFSSVLPKHLIDIHGHQSSHQRELNPWQPERSDMEADGPTHDQADHRAQPRSAKRASSGLFHWSLMLEWWRT